MAQPFEESSSGLRRSPVKVWTVEDNRPFRDMLVRALAKLDGLVCTRNLGSAEELLAALKSEDPPDVILLDVNLPGRSGIESIKDVKRLCVAEVIMLTVNDDHTSIMESICAGATGYLLKTASLPEIRQSIFEVIDGGAPMSPQIARSVMGLFSRLTPPREDHGLTQREKDVLRLLVGGAIKKEVADDLGLSYHTVDKHVRAIYAKLQVHNVSAAVAKAMKDGMF